MNINLNNCYAIRGILVPKGRSFPGYVFLIAQVKKQESSDYSLDSNPSCHLLLDLGHKTLIFSSSKWVGVERVLPNRAF